MCREPRKQKNRTIKPGTLNKILSKHGHPDTPLTPQSPVIELVKQRTTGGKTFLAWLPQNSMNKCGLVLNESLVKWIFTCYQVTIFIIPKIW